MGLGDEIMVSGQVKQIYEKYERKIRVLDKLGRVRNHQMWNHNPKITHDSTDKAIELINGSGIRPYVNYKNTTRTKWVYTDWKVIPGEIFLSSSEQRFSEQFRGLIVIEPHIKPNASPNKLWSYEKCQELIDMAPSYPWVQLGPKDNKWLHNVIQVITPNFRLACSVIKNAKAFVSPEGAVHHAAAAFGVPGVVIFGGMTSPKNTGYDFHANLVYNSPESPCGMRIPCSHCEVAMNSITPHQVLHELEKLL